MLKIFTRDRNRFFNYDIHLSSGRVKHCCEYNYTEFKAEEGTLIFTTNIIRAKEDDYFIKLPNCINKATLDLLCNIDLKIVVDCLSKTTELQGDNMIKFYYANEIWITDGLAISKYHPKYENKIKYTDSKSSYTFKEKAICVHNSLISLLIILITPFKQFDNPERIIGSEENIKLKYDEFSEILNDLNDFVNWVISQESNTDKSYILPIIVICSVVTNLKLSNDDFFSFVKYIIGDTYGMNILINLIRDPSIKHEGGFIGNSSYYTK